MSIGIDGAGARSRLRPARWAIGNTSFSVIAFLLECLAIVAVSVATGAAYHSFVYGTPGEIERFVAIGGLTALIYTVPFAFRDEYDIDDFLEGRRATSRMLVVWTYAFLSLTVIGFLTKTTGLFSRGWLILFYVSGLVAVIAVDAAIAVAVQRAIARGHLKYRRLMLVGSEDEIARALTDIGPAASARVVLTGKLPDAGSTIRPYSDVARDAVDDWLEDVVAQARVQRIDDVVVLLDWAHSAMIERVVTGLTALPVGIHVGAASVIGRFANPRIQRFGKATALSLKCAPLGPLQLTMKRLFDIVTSASAIVLLMPLLVLIAALIKLDSRGPVFFRQRRRGYNHKEFRIWKFRTMNTLDDGPSIVQAQKNDARVTRVGRWLRRYNLDELPQLLNVLTGEMSLVGPRPHAVAHDELYEKRILEYPRRLNVKPGITGWAQVHGYRGATESDDAMRLRVEHDIYYIENWSLVLDIYIIVLTVLSPRAYRNAC
ncbi:MAG: undecaprenyl-phosphate glucose phosphotransferase [Hyphomicrobiaceae bacterium]|nr:undecaprenyl-phosphate glucose phosphotransferase [Hyphomicrobiaceae bacterium]